jgi:hypothetical protein
MGRTSQYARHHDLSDTNNRMGDCRINPSFNLGGGHEPGITMAGKPMPYLTIAYHWLDLELKGWPVVKVMTS